MAYAPPQFFPNDKKASRAAWTRSRAVPAPASVASAASAGYVFGPFAASAAGASVLPVVSWRRQHFALLVFDVPDPAAFAVSADPVVAWRPADPVASGISGPSSSFPC